MRGAKSHLINPVPVPLLPVPERKPGLPAPPDLANPSEANGIAKNQNTQDTGESHDSRISQMELALRRQAEKLNSLNNLVERLVKDNDQSQLEAHELRSVDAS